MDATYSYLLIPRFQKTHITYAGNYLQAGTLQTTDVPVSQELSLEHVLASHVGFPVHDALVLESGLGAEGDEIFAEVQRVEPRVPAFLRVVALRRRGKAIVIVAPELSKPMMVPTSIITWTDSLHAEELEEFVFHNNPWIAEIHRIL